MNHTETDFVEEQPMMDMAGEEIEKALEDFPDYSSMIIVPPKSASQDDQTRAMFQTLARLQLVRIHTANLMAKFFNLPEGSLFTQVEEAHLRSVGLQLASSSAHPHEVIKNIATAFNMDLAPEAFVTNMFETAQQTVNG